MFAGTFHQLRGARGKAMLLLASLIGLLAVVAPVGASAGSTVRITPVAILNAKPQPRVSFTTHRGFSLRPRFQINPIPLTSTQVAALPASVDLSRWDPSARDQGSLGSCVTWAIDYGMLGWYSRHDRNQAVDFNPMYTFSQPYVQVWTKDANGNLTVSASQAKVLDVATSQGNDTIADYGSDFLNYTTQPTAAQIANAAKYKVAGARELFASDYGSGFGTTGQNLIKDQLVHNHPVAIALHIRPGFDQMANYSGITYDDDITGDYSKRGNHEVLAVAYDSYGLWILNSWGLGFGNSGLAQISWRVVQNDVYEAAVISGFAATADTTAPTMGAVTQLISTSYAASSSTVPVQFKWSASDGSGIKSYAVYVSTDGGSFAWDSTLAATATQVTYNLSPGHTYQLRVAAQDTAGNWSGYAYSVTSTPSVSDDKTFTPTNSWARYSDDPGAIGGTYVGTTSLGASITHTFTGHDVAMIGPFAPAAGQATLYCDGVSYGLVDEYSSSLVNGRVVAWCHFATTGQHTIKLVNAATSGRPWLMEDAFVTLS